MKSFGPLLLGITVFSAGVVACKVRRTSHLADAAGASAPFSAELIELIVDVASPSVIVSAMAHRAACFLNTPLVI